MNNSKRRRIKDEIIPLIFTIVAVVLCGYLVFYAFTDGIDKECISQNATWNNVTKLWDGCKIDALAKLEGFA